MIQIYTGLPRSGKTYRAVKFIYDNFVNHKSKEYNKYEYLYTNIGGFKFKEINEILSNHPVIIDDDNAYIKTVNLLNFEDLYKHLIKLYEMSEDEKEDEELLKYLKYHKLTTSLFIIDECYKYFTKRSDPVLVWWLAYHGHLGMDIILILQNKSLMHSDYKAFTEIFIDAQPQSKSLRNNQLRYYHYATETYLKEQRFDTDSIISKKEIFDLYKSGDVHKPKKIIYKFIGIGIFAIFALIFFINLLLTNMKNRAGIPDEVETTMQQTNSSDSFVNEDLELLNIRCNKKYCWNVDTKYNRKYITMTYFKYIVLKFDLELQFSEIKNEIYKLIPQERGQAKVTLAYLEDYYYMVPPDLKTTYLKDLYIPVVNKRKPITAPSPFDNNVNTNNVNGETKKQATSA